MNEAQPDDRVHDTPRSDEEENNRIEQNRIQLQRLEMQENAHSFEGMCMAVPQISDTIQLLLITTKSSLSEHDFRFLIAENLKLEAFISTKAHPEPFIAMLFGQISQWSELDVIHRE